MKTLGLLKGEQSLSFQIDLFPNVQVYLIYTIILILFRQVDVGMSKWQAKEISEVLLVCRRFRCNEKRSSAGHFTCIKFIHFLLQTFVQNLDKVQTYNSTYF
jgi:hypothetical protein